MRWILLWLFLYSTAANGIEPMSDEEEFEKINSGYDVSGCYKLGVNTNSYSKCMESVHWAKVNGDLHLRTTCQNLSPENPEKPVCLEVAEIATNKVNEIDQQKNSDAFANQFNKIFQKDGVICYQPEIPMDKFISCLEKIDDPDKIQLDLTRLNALGESFYNSNLRNATHQCEQTLKALKDRISDAKYKAERAEANKVKLEQEKSARIAELEQEEENRKADAEEERRSKLCGKDFRRFHIGMSKKRFLLCNPVRIYAERAGDIQVYKSDAGVFITVSNGKVFSWVR